MSNIERHISDLLMQHNCVVVPRLGGFVGSFQSAGFSENGGAFNPPYKEIMFNKALSHNDGLVINSYSRKFNISYAEAENVLYTFVDELLKRVLKGEFVQIAEIGTFRADLLGNLYFIQFDGVNFLAKSFGFDTLHILPLTLSERNSQRFEGRSSKMLIRMVTNRRVAASVAAAVGLFIFSTNITIKDIGKSNYSSLASDFGFSSTPIVVSTSSSDTLPLVMVKSNDVTIKAGAVMATKTAYNPFHLIAASVKYKSEAEDLLSLFIKEGKTKAQIVEADGRFRISIEQFTSKGLALKAMDKYRQSHDYKSVWVFKSK